MKYAVLIFLLALPLAAASPVFLDPQPRSGSYYGRGSVVFSVNVTSATLDPGSARLYVISEDAYIHSEPWDNYILQCTQYDTNNWECRKAVSFSIAGSDTQEFYYMEATDSSGTNTIGSVNDPLKFKIDRTPPAIDIISPANNDYVSENITLYIAATDPVSGVNASTTSYSVENGPWNAFSNPASLSAASYQDNTTINIKVRVYDNVNNLGMAEVNVTVDKHPPSVSVINPGEGEYLSGIRNFLINVSDPLSGLNPNNTLFIINGNSIAMQCSGQLCSGLLNTQSYADGAYVINFVAQDNAGNVGSSIVNVNIMNSLPSVTLSPKGFARGAVTMTASIANPAGIVGGATFNLSGQLFPMSCNTGFTSCTYQLDTTLLAERTYQTSVRLNAISYDIMDSGSLTVDNTPPVVFIAASNYTRASLTINAKIVDANPSVLQVTYSFNGQPTAMPCAQQDTALYCAVQYNFPSDGIYNLTVTATDQAGNVGSSSEIITVGPPDEGSATGLSSLCGDGICASYETCSSCPADCGVCPSGGAGSTARTGTGGSSGSNNSSSTSIQSIQSKGGSDVSNAVEAIPSNPFIVSGIAFAVGIIALVYELRRKKTV